LIQDNDQKRLPEGEIYTETDTGITMIDEKFKGNIVSAFISATRKFYKGKPLKIDL